MAGVIERITRKPIQITQPTGEIINGEHEFYTVEAKAFIMEFTRNDFDVFGRLADGKIFLVAPLLRDPVLPGNIIMDGKIFDISGIRIIRDMKSRVMGYRIVTSGSEN